MATILAQYYPAFRMDEVCRVCRGNADKALGKFRCGVCKQSKKDYEAAGLQNEVAEVNYLYLTWLKVKNFKMRTTGIQKLDFVLTMTFGHPGHADWRKYLPTDKVNRDKFICLRTANLDRDNLADQAV